jgi:antitoxin YefM
MGYVNLTEFRANIAKHLDKVEEDRDPLVITRQGRKAIVVMTLDDFRGLEETLDLLSNAANDKRLTRSMANADAGKLKERELIDP